MILKKTNIRFPLIATLVTLLAIAVLVKLGFWQLERAEQKRKLFSDYEQQQSKGDATALSQLGTISSESDRFLFVKMSGDFAQQPVFFLDNKMTDGIVGYQVIALFRPDAKADNYIPVNMGWLPAPASRQELPEIDIPESRQNLTGYLYFPSNNKFVSNTYETELADDRIRVQEFQPNAISKELDIPLTDYTFLLKSPDTLGWQRNWKPQVMSPQKHQGYAVQWFSLAIACLVIFVFAVIKLNKQPKKEETR
ncbi:SURF1 family protein [Idiomarina sp. M1R2S28]|uniref:SURF1-like protein n=1 Tax=Idiomarina rhizosphaerae TaxID=2961572 RepID=A0A9X2FS72_9GAMM|nr:SURF1 family protein [Idiomarina rhizosphaerae]MCP1338081.1 SURF1 family protein [Idiomarina rhizosphaerae]